MQFTKSLVLAIFSVAMVSAIPMDGAEINARDFEARDMEVANFARSTLHDLVASSADPEELFARVNLPGVGSCKAVGRNYVCYNRLGGKCGSCGSKQKNTPCVCEY